MASIAMSADPLLQGAARPTLLSVAGQVVFWTGVLAFFTFFFGRESGDFGHSLLFVGLLLPVAIGTVYMLSDVLVPRFLFKRLYGRFALYTAYTIIASIHLEAVVVILTFIFGAEYRIEEMDPAALDITGLIVGLYVVVFLGICIRLAQRSHRLQASHAAVQQARLETELKLREAELALLKAQIHPHFLFNTLNNLYGLTLERSDAAPDVVLGLSDLLDYVLHQAEVDRVPLQREIDFLETYLSLERIRYDGRLDVRLEAEDVDPGALIAPLLLVPLLENSFKHGARRDAGRPWIRIRLEMEGPVLCVTISNSKPPVSGAADRKSHGLGLENVRRRLELLYPGTHDLKILDEAGHFEVDLSIHLEETHDSIAARR